MKQNNNKFSTVIVDDESLARTRIRRLLKNDNDIAIIGECSNGLEAVETITKSEIDLVFLDIQMPEMNGFEVIDHLDKEKLPIIIFVTAYDKYALKAFEVHALDYLLKPFDDERFYKALDHAKQVIKNSNREAFSKKVLELLVETATKKSNTTSYLDRIVVKSSGSIYFVKTKDIICIKSAGKYLEIIAGDKQHVIRQTMNDMEYRLDPKHFLRIHRSTIISIDHIKEIQHWYKNEYVFILSNGEKLTSGNSYRKNLDRVLTHT